MFDPKKIAVHFSEQLYAKQVRLVIKVLIAANKLRQFSKLNLTMSTFA
jgi:hypothetical protein